MNTHHYLGFRPMAGESLWYAATAEERWVALLAWAVALRGFGIGADIRGSPINELELQEHEKPYFHAHSRRFSARNRGP
jgi:hypothetical protein